MNKRLFAIADIHGCYGKLLQLMDKIQFSPDTDTLVFLGDYIDRGADSKEVVKYVTELREKYPNNVILLKGNHEDMAIKGFLGDLNMYDTWICNGARATLKSFEDEDTCKKVLIPFIQSLQLSYETENFIFVHAGIPADKSLETAHPEELMWDRYGWWFGEKKLIVGHTAKCSVTFLGNMVFVDTGCCYSGMLSAIELNTGEVFSVGAERKEVVIDTEAIYKVANMERVYVTSFPIEHYVQTNDLTREVCGLNGKREEST